MAENPFKDSNNPFKGNDPFKGQHPFDGQHFDHGTAKPQPPTPVHHDAAKPAKPHAAPKKPGAKHAPPAKGKGAKPAKKKPAKKKPLSKSKSPKKAKQNCFNFGESAAKGLASSATEEAIRHKAHKVIKKSSVRHKNRKDSRLKRIAKGKGPNAQLAKGLVKHARSAFSKETLIASAVRKSHIGLPGVAGGVVETGYQLYHTGGHLNRNSAVEIGSATALGAATAAVLVVTLPATAPAAVAVAAGVGLGVAADWAFDVSGAKDKLKDVAGVPQSQRD